MIREDFWVHLWTFDWVRDAFSANTSPLYTTRIFYPDGVSLVSHNIAWLNIALWLPLQAAVGDIAAYNLVFLLIYWLNCWSVYLLAHAETNNTYSSFLAGLTFGFWPYVVSHFDHPNLIFIAWVPFSLLALRQLFLKKRLRDMFVFAFFLILLGITRWQLLIIGGFAIGIYLLFYWWQSGWSRRAFILAISGGIIAGLLLLPLAYWLIQDLLDNPDASQLLFNEVERGQTDLLAFLMPSRLHPAWGDWVESTTVFSNFIFQKLYIPSILFSALPWVLLGLKKRSSAWLWGSMLLIFFTLSLGPILRINGQLYPEIPLPYRLIEDNVLLKIVRRPGRYSIMMGLPMAMLLAHGTAVTLPKIPTIKRRILAIGAAAVLLFEIVPIPFPLVDVNITPKGYASLPPAASPYAIVDVPLTRIPIKLDMFYQLSHGIPLVEGHIARRTYETYAFIDSVPFLASLRMSGTIPDTNVDVSEQLAQLTAVNVQYIVAHKQGLDSHHSAHLRNWLPYNPFYDDDQVTIYTTDPQPGITYTQRDEIADEARWVRARLLRNDESTNTAVIQLSLDAADSAETGQQVCLEADVDLVVCEPLPSLTGLHHVIYELPTQAVFSPINVFVTDETLNPQREPVEIILEWPYRPGE